MTNLSVIDEQITRSSFFAGQEFHEAFRTLRREDPVHWTEHPNYAHGFWSVTKHADVKRILEDPITFSSYTNTHLPPDPTPLTYEERLVRGQEHILAFLDPPKHGIMRRPMNKHFSAPAVNRYTDEVEQIVQDIVGEVGPNGQADLVEEIAAQLPVRLIFSMMDVPREDWDRIRKAAVTFMQPEDPAHILNNDVTYTQMAGITTLTDYISDLALKRRTTPGMDFASIIGAMEVEGRPLTGEEVRWFCFLFFTGGLETTRNATAVGLWRSWRTRTRHRSSATTPMPSRVPSKKCCAGSPRPRTGFASRPRTSRSAARPSRRATGSSPGWSQQTATRMSSTGPTPSTSRVTRTRTSGSASVNTSASAATSPASSSA